MRSKTPVFDTSKSPLLARSYWLATKATMASTRPTRGEVRLDELQ